MNTQNQNQTQSAMGTGMQASIMEEQDLVKTILADEKRVIKEYASAATEAECQMVRDAFTQIFNDTLQIQGEVFQLMSQQGWYGTPDPASASQLQQQVQKHKQTEQQTMQWMQQQGIASQGAASRQIPSTGANRQPQ